MLHSIQLVSSFPNETSTDIKEYYSSKGFCSSAITPDVFSYPYPLYQVAGRVDTGDVGFARYKSALEPGENGYNFLDWKFMEDGKPKDIYVFEHNDQCLGTLLLESIILGGLGSPTSTVSSGGNPLYDEYYYKAMSPLQRLYGAEKRLGFVQNTQICNGPFDTTSMPPLNCNPVGSTVNNAILNLPLGLFSQHLVDAHKLTDSGDIVAELILQAGHLDKYTLTGNAEVNAVMTAVANASFSITMKDYIYTLALIHGAVKLPILGHPPINWDPLILDWNSPVLGAPDLANWESRTVDERLDYPQLKGALAFYLSTFMVENCNAKRGGVSLPAELSGVISSLGLTCDP